MADDNPAQKFAEQYGIKGAVEDQLNTDVDDTYKEKLLDFSSSLQLIEQSLRGYQIRYKMFETQDGRLERWEFVRIPDTGVWKPYQDLTDQEKDKIENTGLCNEEGVQVIMTFLQAVANPIVAASDMDRKKTYKTGFSDATAIFDELHDNMDRYGIEDYNDLDVIMAIINTVIAGVLGKAEDKTLLEHLSKITKVSEIKTEDGDDDSRVPDIWS